VPAVNKAFVREPDAAGEYCPRCGSMGNPVGESTLRAFVVDGRDGRIAGSARFCPSARCQVVYFDSFERVILTTDLSQPVYPKDPTAPICGCLGLTEDEVAEDAARRDPSRVKTALEAAKAPDAQCRQRNPSGRPCTAYLQKCYVRFLNS
jgi:hypothetical protein